MLSTLPVEEVSENAADDCTVNALIIEMVTLSNTYVV
jgi:hypothetical protein